jgi:hypothetical protein
MIRGPIVCSTVVLLSMLSSVTTANAQERTSPAQDRFAVENGWQFDYRTARSLAHRSNKPLMIVFR